MKPLQSKEIAGLLGIYEPWFIKDIDISSQYEQVVVTIEKQTTKKEFGWFKSSDKGVNKSTLRWRHNKLGQFATIIQTHATVNEITEIDDSHMPFFGKSNSKLTNELCDSIQMASTKGLNATTIQELFDIPLELIETELQGANERSAQQKLIASLPLIGNPVWHELVTDRRRVSTKNLPLKLLLSRLKMDVHNANDALEVVKKSSAELRAFFVKNINALQTECVQLGVQIPTKEEPKKAKSKYVLPGINSLIWNGIFEEQIQLNTDHMGFKFQLARQKKAYWQADNDKERADAIRNLAMAIKHNARSLIPLLKQITELVEQEAQTKKSVLPPADHSIWKELLENENLLPSTKINYRLLLTRLKTVYSRTQGQEPPKQLHNFFIQNSEAMQEEVKIIQQLALAQ